MASAKSPSPAIRHSDSSWAWQASLRIIVAMPTSTPACIVTDDRVLQLRHSRDRLRVRHTTHAQGS